MNEQIRISGKNLGELALPNFCPRCFWIRLHLQNRLPFQVFPGIFSSIDSYTKHIVHGWIDDTGTAPPWLSQLGGIAGYVDPPHFSKFFLIDDETNVKLTGAADGILKMQDGSYMIIDYKTARYTNGQDELLPIYETQLNAYAMIAEQIGISPITGLALVYMEPASSSADAAKESNRCASGFRMQFNAHLKPITLATQKVPELLRKTRIIYSETRPPNSNADCTNCTKTENLVYLF